MATAVASTPTNGEANPSSPVDLQTIPISPDGGSSDEKKNPNGASGDEQITVFHDKDNFNVKHPLMNEWTLWFTKPPSGKVRLLGGVGRSSMLTVGEGRQLE
jgi:translation initiation factor 4E